MSRVQLALNVSDIDAAVAFYGKLFATEPAKRRPGYANFAISDPPLKLVLIEDKDRAQGIGGALNHLGVEVESPVEVEAAHGRFSDESLDTLLLEKTDCCYAVQDKVWVNDTDGVPWEWYAVLGDSPLPSPLPPENAGGCCTPSTHSSDGGRPISACC